MMLKAWKVNRLVAVLIMVIVLFPLFSSCYTVTVFEDGSGRDWNGRYYTPADIELRIFRSQGCGFQICIEFDNERAEQNFWAIVNRRLGEMNPLDRQAFENALRGMFTNVQILPPGAGGAIDDLPSTTTVGGHSGGGGGKGGGGK